MKKKVYYFLIVFGLPFLGFGQSFCEGTLSENILSEGDFGSGAENIPANDPGLAPGYTYDASPPPFDGSYTITNNTGSFNGSAWLAISDNSPDPQGYMMVVNASHEPGLFFERTLSLCENTTYEFAADIINLINPNGPAANSILPNIDFLINGEVLYSTGDVPEDAAWHTYGFTFSTAPNTTDIVLTLRNNAPGGNGNDLALDNISFRVCGPEVVLPDVSVICTNDAAVLEAVLNGNSFSSPVFQWQISTDGGNNWTDVNDGNMATLSLPNPIHQNLYRVLVANATPNLSNPSCRVISNPTLIDFQTIETEIVANTCANEPFDFYGTPLATTGTYEHILTATNGCDSTIRLQLTVLDTIEIEQTLELCPGDEWNGQFFYENAVIVDDMSVGENGCDSTTITYIHIDFPSDFAINGEEQLCEGESSELSVGEFANYQWSTGANTSSIIVNESGWYHITVTTEANCIATDSFEIQVSNISADIQSSMPTCQDENAGSIEIQNIQGGNAPYLIAFNGAAFQNEYFFDNLNGDNYDIFIQDVNGCEYQETVILEAPDELIIDIGSDVRLNLGDSIPLEIVANQPLNSILWSPAEGLSCTDCPAPFVHAQETTTYTIEAIAENGCQANTSITVLVNKDRPIFVPTAFSPNGDGINDEFRIFVGSGVAKIKRLEVYNRWGGLVFGVEEVLPNEKAAQWNGRFKGEEVEGGVLVWLLEIEYINETNEILVGEINLIR